MRYFMFAALAYGLVATGAGAAPKPAAPPKQVLQKGLQTLVAPLSAQPNAKPGSSSSSQGSAHASEVAIMKVCSHNNPSAQRSAICAHPVSPD